MYLPNNKNLSTHVINSNYLPWLISFIIATILILITLVIVIIICSFKKKQKLILIKSSNHVETGIFTVNGSNMSFDKIKNDYVNEKSDMTCYNNRTVEKTNCLSSFCCCCCNCRGSSAPQAPDEGHELLTCSRVAVSVDLREKVTLTDYLSNHTFESIPDLSATPSDGMPEHENGRISHIDRELPPIPKASVPESNSTNFNESIVEPEIVSMTESENYNELKQSDEIDSDPPNFTICNDSNFSRNQTESTTSSPSKFGKFQRSSIEYTNCCCGSHQDILSSDDLSSTDYDPTYAAIKRKKPSCPVCGVPSVYTPANSNRNSNLSLQFNSCLTSPIRNVNLKPSICDSLNNSTYASIAKLPKDIPENNFNKEQDNSGSSTIKRQRSISQGDIIRSSILKVHESQKSEIKLKESDSNDISKRRKDVTKNHNIFNNSGFNTISLWSLMASNRNSPYSMFPIIPERTYGQSVVDLIEKLRESEEPEKSNKFPIFGLNGHERSFTPPILFNNSFKKSGPIMNSKGRVWTPPSCQMVHGNVYTKSGVCSPLKVFDRNLNSYDFNFPEITGTYRKGNSSFQPTLTPPLSPMDCLSPEKDECNELTESRLPNQVDTVSDTKSKSSVDNNNGSLFQSTSVYEDLDYYGAVEADKEIEVINNGVEVNVKQNEDYDYILTLDQAEINGELKLTKYSENTTNPRSRPISIHLYADDSLTKEKGLKYRFDKCEIFGFSSVQMSPLMEQSIENSSSKTTLSSLSFHQFHRLISSEDSCAKSPPSTELSPSLDNFEISPDTGAFLYNDLMWSKLNSAFDDYDTFE